MVWSDSRDFCGDYEQPTTEQDPDPAGGRSTGIPDLVFAAAQYRAEVARLTADPSWGTEGTKTVRLLRRYLSREKDYLAQHGWKLEFAEQRRDGYWVAFLDGDDAQTIVPWPPGQERRKKPPRWPTSC